MLAFLGWCLIGLLAGLFARLLVPGKQAMGLLATMGLGMAGSLLGGGISMFIFGDDPANPGLHPAGFLMSTIGAILVLLVVTSAASRRA